MNQGVLSWPVSALMMLASRMSAMSRRPAVLLWSATGNEVPMTGLEQLLMYAARQMKIAGRKVPVTDQKADSDAVAGYYVWTSNIPKFRVGP